MEQVHIREANGEIVIFLDKHYSTPLHALQEATKALQREVIRYESHSTNYISDNSTSDRIPER